MVRNAASPLQQSSSHTLKLWELGRCGAVTSDVHALIGCCYACLADSSCGYAGERGSSRATKSIDSQPEKAGAAA